MNEGLSIAKIAEALDIPTSAVDNYYRHAIKRLRESLKSAVQSHVIRYSGNALDGFKEEWGALSDYLKEHGGLAEALRKAELHMKSSELDSLRQKGVRRALENSGVIPAREQ